MAARTKGQQLLEKLQEREYRRLGRLGDYEKDNSLQDADFNRRMVEEMIQKRAAFLPPEVMAEMREKLLEGISANAKAEMPTKYEEPSGYHLMTNLARQVEDAASELGHPLPIRPQLGTLPTQNVNAMAVRVPDSDEYLILFESELFTFALLLSKVVARAIPFKGSESGMLNFSTEGEDIEKSIAENPEITRRFREVVLAYLIKGRPSAAPAYLPEEPYGTLAAILRQSMELFIMAHEYAHIISGHLSESKTAPIDVGGQHGDEVIRSWQQELEADAQGLELMVRAMQKRNHDLALSYWGADLFFSCIEVVEQGISIMRTGRESEEGQLTDSHPPVQLRREMLRELLKRSLPEEHAQAPIQLGMVLEQLIASLWSATKPLLGEYQRAGGKLSPIWG
jgi:hypothetical protein